MRSEDVGACVKLIGQHPVIGPRYGHSLGELGRAWQRLLGSSALKAVVFEEGARLWGVGVSAFVQESFLREIKQLPLFWIGPGLARRIAAGESPLLSERQIEEANACGGLSAVTWEGCIGAEFAKRSELYHELMTAFLEQHRGYLWKEQIASQAESAGRLRWTLHSGGRMWDAGKGCYTAGVGAGLTAIARAPHVVGITRDMDRGRPSSWVGALFDYHAPRLGLSRGEQRLLLAAFETGATTDRELAAALRLSLPSVKKMWLSAYARAAAVLPEMLPGRAMEGRDAMERGKEKKRRLLAYVRAHPEELRPVAKKLLASA
ncbi:MAG: hypothetical protein ACRD04_03120 [Terriglobales bacterium]